MNSSDEIDSQVLEARKKRHIYTECLRYWEPSHTEVEKIYASFEVQKKDVRDYDLQEVYAMNYEKWVTDVKFFWVKKRY